MLLGRVCIALTHNAGKRSVSKSAKIGQRNTRQKQTAARKRTKSFSHCGKKINLNNKKTPLNYWRCLDGKKCRSQLKDHKSTFLDDFSVEVIFDLGKANHHHNLTYLYQS